MRKIVCKVCLALLLCSNIVQAENWTRSTIDIKEKGWSSGDGYKVKADLVDYPYNLNECDGSDKALRFNVQKLYNDVNDASFDVNNIYVDGVLDGESALNVVQADNLRHHNGWQFRCLWKEDGNGTDWAQYNGYVYACIGSFVQVSATPHALKNIILWYKNPDKTTYRNVSSTDVCSANGSNWLQKILIKYRSGWLDSFCQDSNNKANLTLDTSSNTATITSNTPLKSNGSKTITISFSQAGVSSAQVKAGIGQGYGGNASGIVNGTGAGYDPDPNGDTWAGYAHHVGLKYMKVGKKSSGHWDGSKVWSISFVNS